MLEGHFHDLTQHILGISKELTHLAIDWGPICTSIHAMSSRGLLQFPDVLLDCVSATGFLCNSSKVERGGKLFRYLLWQCFLCFPLCHVVLIDWGEVTLLQVPDDVALAKDGLESVPEILQEALFLHVVGLLHHCKHGRHLLLLRREIHRSALIQHFDAMDLILRREQHPAVIQLGPAFLTCQQEMRL